MKQLIGRTRPDGTKEVKTIFELTEKEAAGYAVLGRATCVNIIHCFSMGAAHKERFWERVYGYRFVQDNMTEVLTRVYRSNGKDDEIVTVEFYETRT